MTKTAKRIVAALSAAVLLIAILCPAGGSSIHAYAAQAPNKVATLSIQVTSSPSARLTWKKKTKISGYQILYGKKKNLSDAKKITVPRRKQKAKLITGLSKGKKYYVRVRCYRKVGSKNYYSGWSSKKSVTVKE